MTGQTSTASAEAVRLSLRQLAEVLLRYYSVTEPPVPIERMLKEPPAGLATIDLDQVSYIMEHGLYRYEPRLAMARLLYREIANSATAMKTLGVNVPSSISYADVRLFARCLLMPSDWITTLSQQGLSVEQISIYLQVPPNAVITRLAELGLPVPTQNTP